MKSITVEQYNDLIKAIKRNEEGSRLDRNLAIFELTYFLGLRVSEIGALKLTDVDLTNRTITVNTALKKGVKGTIYTLEKNIYKLLKNWISHLPYNDGPLFPSQKRKDQYTYKGISRQQLEKLIKKYGALAKIPPEVRHMHAIRHSTATHLRLIGKDLKVIQQRLRHKSPSSTMIYLDVTNKEMDDSGKDLMAFRNGDNKIKW